MFLIASVLLVSLAFACAKPAINDWPPLNGCHYNISANVTFRPAMADGLWYIDSSTAQHPIRATCFKWSGTFNKTDGDVGTMSFRLTINEQGLQTTDCTGPNYADAPADFSEKCIPTGHPDLQYLIQWRFAETDYKTYALATLCVGYPGFHHDTVALLARNKNGLDAATRERLIARLVAAGWTRADIFRVPSQNGC